MVIMVIGNNGDLVLVGWGGCIVLFLLDRVSNRNLDTIDFDFHINLLWLRFVIVVNALLFSRVSRLVCHGGWGASLVINHKNALWRLWVSRGGCCGWGCCGWVSRVSRLVCHGGWGATLVINHKNAWWRLWMSRGGCPKVSLFCCCIFLAVALVSRVSRLVCHGGWGATLVINQKNALWRYWVSTGGCCGWGCCGWGCCGCGCCGCVCGVLVITPEKVSLFLLLYLPGRCLGFQGV